MPSPARTRRAARSSCRPPSRARASSGIRRRPANATGRANKKCGRRSAAPAARAPRAPGSPARARAAGRAARARRQRVRARPGTDKAPASTRRSRPARQPPTPTRPLRSRKPPPAGPPGGLRARRTDTAARPPRVPRSARRSDRTPARASRGAPRRSTRATRTAPPRTARPTRIGACRPPAMHGTAAETADRTALRRRATTCAYSG